MTPQTINMTVLLDVQTGSQKTGETQKGNGAGAEQGFLQFLDKALGRNEKEGLPWCQSIAEILESEEGWLESFKHVLCRSGIGLKDMSLSGKALEGLKKLLLADGCAEDDVKDLINGFVGFTAKKEIGIPEILHKIGELRAKSQQQSADFVLEPSVLPHLTNLFRSFGLNVQQIEGVINQARIDGGKLSLKMLAQTLKKVVTDIKNGIEPEPTKTSAEAVKETLTRIGMAKEADALKGPVSLGQFVRLVEDKLASLVPYRLSHAEKKKQITGLLENVSVISDAKVNKSLATKQRGMELGAFPLLDLDAKKTTGRQVNKGVTWESRQEKQKAGTAKGVGANTKGGTDTKEIDIKKSTQLEVRENEMSVKAEKLVEAVTHRPYERTSNTRKSEAPAGFHDHAVSRGSTTAPVAKPDVRSIPMHVVNQVGRRLGLAVRRGENHVRLQLRPPHLGSIQLDLAMKDNGVKIAMVAEHQYVKDLMATHVNELREALSSQGVELQKIDVEINQNFGQSMANAGREFHSAQPWAKRMALASDGSGEEALAVHMMSHPMDSDGQVDMFA